MNSRQTLTAKIMSTKTVLMGMSVYECAFDEKKILFYFFFNFIKPNAVPVLWGQIQKTVNWLLMH